jgi:iron complex outermembrane receptor protein
MPRFGSAPEKVVESRSSMRSIARFALVSAAAMAAAAPAEAQERAADNAVTQAEDAFGFSVGRESLGIYSSGNVRGFSPIAAGNVRIDGLYFDPIFLPGSGIADSSSIKVGLSAQGYPFAAPSGIVDLRLRRLQNEKGASVILNGDQYGSFGLEVDGALPLSRSLALGYGATGNHVEFSDGTNNWNHSESLMLRWHPSPAVEIVPFWTLGNDYDDEAGPFYIPAGPFLPPRPRQRHFTGPSWVDYRYSATDHGLLASYAPAEDWTIRLGAFRSVFDTKTSYANLLVGERPDGSGEHLVIADPREASKSVSGELRVTHSIVDGPRLHLLYLSARERDARHEFGGSDQIDFGPGQIGQSFMVPKPTLVFGPQDQDMVRQTTYGIAYDGRWKNVGELGLSLARADYRKTTALAGVPAIVSRSSPWLYSGTVAANLAPSLILYAGYARGLEESGVAPANAANRNQPLPAVITEQKDAGFRLHLAGSVKLVAGVFDLSRPYFGFDAANRYLQIGTTHSRGAEFSVSGALTRRLDMVLGGVFLDPRVVSDGAVQGTIGRRAVGLAGHTINLNLNWRTPLAEGLAFDLAVVHRGSMAATTDNQVILGPRVRVDFGGHYRFRLARHNATLRLQMSNVFDNEQLGLIDSGVYSLSAGRVVSGYLTVDI